MSAPATEAGRSHAEAWIESVELEWGRVSAEDREEMLAEVAAIEQQAAAEAVARERERLREALQPPPGNYFEADLVSRAAVLALLEPEG